MRTYDRVERRRTNFLHISPPNGCLNLDSRGVMVLAMVHAHVRVPNRGFDLDIVTADYIQVLRLRLLWFVMCESLIYPITHDDEEAARVTNEELLDVFPSKLVKIRHRWWFAKGYKQE
ncbi:hypothetical protein GN244_ATG06912 [Phytophthora infestans]|uniref:Uncharacterized protein n=1 Tax=Phytophthora infestans TaxID=4787 RepID=A0A833TC28_PHYIN|nr:hypothetical protein GN244_ATG06912 [Phytophthora infestans]KAF4136039.1 hypothetical protein GN958_ATG14785 [Phytophthora infestans]